MTAVSYDGPRRHMTAVSYDGPRCHMTVVRCHMTPGEASSTTAVSYDTWRRRATGRCRTTPPGVVRHGQHVYGTPYLEAYTLQP